MLFTKKSLILFGLILALMMASVPFSMVGADVTSVQPANITNDVATIITVKGDGFDASSKVLLDGVELPGTVFINNTELQVTVPAGVAVGEHIITVTSTGGSAILTVSAPPPFTRPQIYVKSSWTNVKQVTTGQEFKFAVDFENAGNMPAYNAQAVFSSPDLIPLNTGGVIVLKNPLDPGSNFADDQRFIPAGPLYGKTFILVDVTVTYYDDKGTPYSDKFTLTIPVGSGGGGGGSGVVATATPTGVRSGQLIISSYSTSVDPLQPGSEFKLIMTVQNMGNDKAQRVTMIVGGGSSGSGEDGTPQPGGVSGGSGEFSNFAPLGSSNIQSLGDLPASTGVQASQDLIVNVSTNPGAYPMKVTFSYLNGKGEVVNDEQVITLLVFSLPNVEISFYRPLDMFFAGQPAQLPLQIVNLGKRTAVLGNMTVTSGGGMVENGTALVGSLDAGGYYTLDPMFYPDAAGTVQLNVLIEYTDDFNRARTIEKTLEVNVEEGFFEPTPEPGMEGGGGDFFPTEETFLQKVWRFILGLFGLDSAPPASSPEMEGPPLIEPGIPAPGGGGGGSGPKG